MLQRFLSDVKFYELLFLIDKDLAEKTRSKKCLFCGNTLHQGNYFRKPRGGPQITDDDFKLCFSFCCYICRKRLKPPSFRFLGRRVYLGAVFVLISAMLYGASSKRLKKLQKFCGANLKTLKRWRTYWMEIFPRTDLWRTFSPRFTFLKMKSGSVVRQLFQIFRETSLLGTLKRVLGFLVVPKKREGVSKSTLIFPLCRKTFLHRRIPGYPVYRTAMNADFS